MTHHKTRFLMKIGIINESNFGFNSVEISKMKSTQLVDRERNVYNDIQLISRIQYHFSDTFKYNQLISSLSISHSSSLSNCNFNLDNVQNSSKILNLRKIVIIDRKEKRAFYQIDKLKYFLLNRLSQSHHSIQIEITSFEQQNYTNPNFTVFHWLSQYANDETIIIIGHGAGVMNFFFVCPTFNVRFYNLYTSLFYKERTYISMLVKKTKF